MGVQRIAKTRYILLIIVLTSTVLHMFLTDIIPRIFVNDTKKITYDECDSQKTKNPLGKMSIKNNSCLFYVSQQT